MNEFDVIKLMTETKLEVLKDKDENYDMYKKLYDLMEDEALFFKISKKNAYRFFERLGIKEESFDEVYEKLVSKEQYQTLVHEGKIDRNDKNLMIKFGNVSEEIK